MRRLCRFIDACDRMLHKFFHTGAAGVGVIRLFAYKVKSHSGQKIYQPKRTNVGGEIHYYLQRRLWLTVRCHTERPGILAC